MLAAPARALAASLAAQLLLTCTGSRSPEPTVLPSPLPVISGIQVGPGPGRSLNFEVTAPDNTAAV